jgi:hypothetical protein
MQTKTKLPKEQKEKMLLKFLHNDYKINKEQYWNDLDLLAKESARYYAIKGNKISEEHSGRKWISVSTKEFGWNHKHILRSEYINFKI